MRTVCRLPRSETRSLWRCKDMQGEPMEETDALRILRALLLREGAEWREENGWLRFRSKHGAMLWETDCRMTDGAMLLYGRFPFRCADADAARTFCEEMNRKLIRGALYLTEDGTPVYRCTADTDDVYGAEQRISEALHYSAQVIAYCWGRLSGI